MSKDIKKYKLLISCPSDIEKEKEIIKEEVDKFNKVYGDAHGVQVETVYWKDNVYPEYGDAPQEIINRQLLPECDAVVALFWSRLGTPTDNYDSGTIEEIEQMASEGKHAFVYFSDSEIHPSNVDSEQLEKVKEFKQKSLDNGVIGEYSDSDKFRSLFSVHMPKFFIDLYQKEKEEPRTNSKLELRGIENGVVKDTIKLSKFVPEAAISKELFKEKIIDKINEVNSIKLEKTKVKNNSSKLVFDWHSEVSIEVEDKKIIERVAKLSNVTLSDGFFDLGNLERSLVPDGLHGSHSLKGSKEECDKYNKIMSILQSIDKFGIWAPIEEKFFCLDAIKIALTNIGPTYDEDVEVSLIFPKNSILKLGELPKISDDAKDYIINTVGLFEIFGICSSAHYMNFFELDEPLTYHPISDIGKLMGEYDNSEQDYLSELSSVFCYSLFEDGDNMILKIRFNYIKQNTTIAFPSVIFLKEQIETIKYRITSKNNPSIIEGEIGVVKE